MKWYRDIVEYWRSGGRLELISRSIFWALLGTVLLSPIPFGSIYPWSYTLMAIVVAVLVGLWSLQLLISGAPPPVTLAMIWFPATMFGLVIAWIVIQAAPWTPESWHNPVWRETAAVLGRDVQGYISVNPHATETTLMRLLTYAGIFWLALQYGRSGKRALQVFYAVAVAGLVYAVYGLAVEFTGSESILWYEKERYKASLTSTFRYKNAYATYAGLGLIAAITLLVRALWRDDYTAMGPNERLRTVLALIFEKTWFLILAFIVIVTALLLANSRGGFLATIVALLCFAGMLCLAPRSHLPYGKMSFAAVLAAGLFFVALSGGSVADRLAETDDNDIRSRIYAYTLDAIGERPLTGWGANSFEDVFAQFRGPDFDARFIRAHNEYLDNALGMGLPAAIALLGTLVGVGVLCFRGTRRRQRDNFYPAAGVATTVLVGIHSMVDFTLQVPAVAATFALLAGVCCAQSWSSLVRRLAQSRD